MNATLLCRVDTDIEITLIHVCEINLLITELSLYIVLLKFELHLTITQKVEYTPWRTQFALLAPFI